MIALIPESGIQTLKFKVPGERFWPTDSVLMSEHETHDLNRVFEHKRFTQVSSNPSEQNCGVLFGPCHLDAFQKILSKRFAKLEEIRRDSTGFQTVNRSPDPNQFETVGAL